MDEDLHGYTRVTEVLSLLKDWSKTPPHMLKEAARRGEIVHQAIEGIIPISAVDTQYQPYIEAALEWRSIVKPKILHEELRLFHHPLKLTGKMDLIAEIQGSSVLLDYKTPVNFCPTWTLQMNAYQRLCQENSISIDYALILQLTKKGKYKVTKIQFQDAAWFEFLSLLATYRSQHGTEENHTF